MTYQSERDEFLAAFGREFPNASRDVAAALLRAATGSQRYNEIASSIDVGARELARLEKREANRMLRVVGMLAMIGAKLIDGGDPRGFPFLIACPSGRTYDFGGRGLGVPGRGLPARCFQ